MASEFAKPSSMPQLEPWTDTSVRRFESGDFERCAGLLAARSGWSLDRARRSVGRWRGHGTDDQIVVVAERDATVHGYGRANRLDPGAGGGTGPAGWFLTGLVVAPESRRHGIGQLLTRARLAQLVGLSDEAWYFANERNIVSIDLHARFGFRPYTRDFQIPGVCFEDGAGILFRLALPESTPASSRNRSRGGSLASMDPTPA